MEHLSVRLPGHPTGLLGYVGSTEEGLNLHIIVVPLTRTLPVQGFSWSSENMRNLLKLGFVNILDKVAGEFFADVRSFEEWHLPGHENQAAFCRSADVLFKIVYLFCGNVQRASQSPTIFIFPAQDISSKLYKAVENKYCIIVWI